MSLGNLPAFFAEEAGLLAFYERNADGVDVLSYRTRRVAIAYDFANIVLFQMGAPEPVMAWGAAERRRLQAEGRLSDASNMGVTLLPDSTRARHLNEVLQSPERFIYLLQTLRVI